MQMKTFLAQRRHYCSKLDPRETTLSDLWVLQPVTEEIKNPGFPIIFNGSESIKQWNVVFAKKKKKTKHIFFVSHVEMMFFAFWVCFIYLSLFPSPPTPRPCPRKNQMKFVIKNYIHLQPVNSEAIGCCQSS